MREKKACPNFHFALGKLPFLGFPTNSSHCGVMKLPIAETNAENSKWRHREGERMIYLPGGGWITINPLHP